MRKLGYRLPVWAQKECYIIAIKARMEKSIEKTKDK